MPVILKNNAFSTLATAITASDTAIVVADGNQFPALSAGEYFYATLVSPAGTTEIIKVTARVSNSLTVVRAQDGSSAASFQVGARVDMRVNVASISELRDEAYEISIADAGGYYAATDVEGALRELGGIRNPKDVATLLADTALSYSNVAAGDIVRTRSEGFSYEVAASVATNQHVTTAGGVKLYVLPGDDGRANILAFGADATGVVDATAAFNTAGLRFKAILVPDGLYRVNNIDWSRATVGDFLDVKFNKNARLRADDNLTDIVNISAQRRCIFEGGRFMRGAKAFNLGGIGQITAYCKFIDNEFGGIGAASGDVVYGYWGDTAIANVWQRPVFGSDAPIPSVDYGIYFTGASADQTNNNRIYDPQLLNIRIDGIVFADASGALRHNDNEIIGGLIEEVGGHGVFVSRSARKTRIASMFVEDAGSRAKAPIYLDRTFDATVSDCQFATANRQIDGWVHINGGSGVSVVNNDMQIQFDAGEAITGATQASPVVITATAHGYVTGDQVLIQGVGGMTEINNRAFNVTVINADSYSLDGEIGTGYAAYTSGGTSYRITPLIKTTNLFSEVVATGNKISNAAFPSLIVPFSSALFNASPSSAARNIVYDTFANTSTFTGDEIYTRKDLLGNYLGDGTNYLLSKSVSLAAQDTWYTVGRVVFPSTATSAIAASLEIFIAAGIGGALGGDSFRGKRFLYRTVGGGFVVRTDGTDFETFSASVTVGTSAYQVQIVLDPVYNNIGLIQVRRTSGGATATFIAPFMQLYQSHPNIGANRVELLPG